MSQENVDVAWQAYDAWNRGDLEWFVDHMTEDFQFRPGLGFPGISRRLPRRGRLDAVFQHLARGVGGRHGQTWSESRKWRTASSLW